MPSITAGDIGCRSVSSHLLWISASRDVADLAVASPTTKKIIAEAFWGIEGPYDPGVRSSYSADK
jgi:hypothetical protein